VIGCAFCGHAPAAPLDGRLTQAVAALFPTDLRHIFWTQHTVKHPTENRSIVRWYGIDPAATPPVVIRTGTIGDQPEFGGTYVYNAACGSPISTPARRTPSSTPTIGGPGSLWRSPDPPAIAAAVQCSNTAR
jgi:hypothetical protein